MPEPCMHAPLPYESIAFLALKRLPLPPGLSNSVAHFSARLALAMWMSLWDFILCISSLLRTKHCLGMGFLFFNLAHVPFYPASMGWLVFLLCHYTAPTVISLIFCLIVTSGLTGWSTCHVNFLPYSFFWYLLPSIPTGPIHFVPWASLGNLGSFHHFLPLSFSWLLLNSLGFHNPITTSLPLGLLAFEPTSFTNSFLWTSLSHFYFLSIFYNSHGPTISIFGVFLACLLSLRPIIILVDLLTIIPIILAKWSLFYYSFFFPIFFILVGFFCYWAPFVNTLQ